MAAMPKAKAGIASAVLAMNRILAGAVGLAVVSALFQSLLRDQLDSELGRRGVELDGSQREQLDGLLAGSKGAREALSSDPKALLEQIREIAADAFTFALGNATWVLVALGALSTVLTWWLVEPKQPSEQVPEAARTPEHHHHRFGGFHI